jgi:flagellar biosynthesis protein
MSQDDKDKMTQAAALKYNAQDDSAPYIVALGSGHVAKKMVEAAQENHIQVVQDQKLSAVLAKMSVGDEIPEELYKVVAEILVFVNNMDSKYGSRFGLDKSVDITHRK